MQVDIAEQKLILDYFASTMCIGSLVLRITALLLPRSFLSLHRGLYEQNWTVPAVKYLIPYYN